MKIERFLTEEPMTFRKKDWCGVETTSSGVGYVLWDRNGYNGKPERYRDSSSCESQREADEWGQNMVDIYDCQPTNRLKELAR